jgi:hypothetical protein
MRTQKATKLLVVLLGLIVISSVHANVIEWNHKDLLENSKTADDTLVFILNKAGKKSKTILDQLPEMAKKLKTAFPSLKIASVDKSAGANNEDILFENFNVVTFPSLIFFKHGVKMGFTEAITLQNIQNYLKPRFTAAIKNANTVLEIGKHTGDVFTVYFYTEDKSLDDWFKGTSAKFPRYNFVRVANTKIFHEFASKYYASVDQSLKTVVAARRFHDDSLMFLQNADNVTRTVITKFIRRSEKPYWTYFSNNSINLIEQSDKHVTLFVFDNQTEKSALDTARNLSIVYYDDMISILVDRSAEKGIELLESLGLPTGQSDIFMVYKEVNGAYVKYVGNKNSTNTSEGVSEFMEKALQSEWKAYYPSEEPPSKDLFEGVTTLVGKTISSQVFKEKDNFHVVFMYDQQTASQIPAFQKISKQLKHEKLKFYIYNSQKNEHPHVDPLHHGTVVLYSNVKKLKIEKAMPFEQHLKATELRDFLKKTLAKDEHVSKYLETIVVNDDL